MPRIYVNKRNFSAVITYFEKVSYHWLEFCETVHTKSLFWRRFTLHQTMISLKYFEKKMKIFLRYTVFTASRTIFVHCSVVSKNLKSNDNFVFLKTFV